MASTRRWWSELADECPITLEPLSELPYPPFALSDGKDDGGGESAGAGRRRPHFFDGLALAAYVVSRGAFVNPLTRAPLDYDDCARLDEYLREHAVRDSARLREHRHRDEHLSSSVLGLGGDLDRSIVSVREAFALRESIRVKADGRGRRTAEEGEERRRLLRAEALRNEAAAALRGLFVFGHYPGNSGRGGAVDDDYDGGRRETSSTTIGRWSSSGPSRPSYDRAPAGGGGFDLLRRPRPNSDASSREGEGLRVIDDDEAAHEAADVAAWREIQGEFPYLVGGDGAPRQSRPVGDGLDDARQSHLLETVRRTANLTLIEERERKECLERRRRICFLEALERKRERIDAREKARKDVADSMSREREAEQTLASARREIEEWRIRQWAEWDRAVASSAREPIVRAADDDGESMSTAKSPTPGIVVDPDDRDGPELASRNNRELSTGAEEERDVRAAAKRKAKRRKAKERAKERARSERLETEENERAMAIRREKAESTKKCCACGEGILGRGFERFGMVFCSPVCARSGPSS